MFTARMLLLKVILLFSVVFCGLGVYAQPTFAASKGYADPRVQQLLQSGKSVNVWISISGVAAPSQESVTSGSQTKLAMSQWSSSVENAKKKVLSQLKITNRAQNYKYVPTIQAQFNSLSELNAVLALGSDVSVSLPPNLETSDIQSFPLIKSDPSLNDGRNGAGTEIAVLDDTGNHGANVAAIIKGVAPGAQVVKYNFNNILLATSQIIARKASGFNVVAVNMSFGIIGVNFAPGSCFNTGIDAAVSSLEAVGILPVAASGNDVQNGRINAPACLSGVVAVGATYDQNWPNTRWTYPATQGHPNSCSDRSPLVKQPTCFTNVSTDLDVWAPGQSITAAGITRSGTSQATAHVAGAVAIMKQGVPNANISQIKRALKSAGPSITFRGITRRFLNVRGATNALFQISALPQ